MGGLLLLDARGCSPPLLRAAARFQHAQQAACVAVGPAPGVHAAAAAGLRIDGSHACAGSSALLDARALRRALAPVVRRATGAFAVGAGAPEIAGALGLEALDAPLALPDPVPALARAALRETWEVTDAHAVFLLAASPAQAGDARAALDIVGRCAFMRGPCALVVHPDAGRIERTRHWARVNEAGWKLIVDERADDPELLAAAIDAAIALELPGSVDPRPLRLRSRAAVREASAAPWRRWASWAAELARGTAERAPAADAIVAQVLVRAGVPLAVATGSSAHASLGAAVPEGCFDPRRPNLGAHLLLRLARDPDARAALARRQRAALEAGDPARAGAPASEARNAVAASV
ncbi:MAG: hypothetical protein U0625_07975 [Phycisphaerales bacterium]